jgi:PAS domain S-box-containing protein
LLRSGLSLGGGGSRAGTGHQSAPLAGRKRHRRRRAQHRVRGHPGDAATEPDDTLARLHFALEAANAGTWQWEVATGEVHWSDNLEAIHGLPPGSFGGDFRSFLDDVDPRDCAEVLAQIQKAIDGGGDYHVEYRLATAAAGERWVEGKGRMVVDEHGRPLRMTGVCMDVTPRKRAEQRIDLVLRELRHRVKNLLAVVRSLAAQTLRHAPSLEAFDQAFQGRLAGLAGAHDLLVDTNWEGASLRALVVAQLSPWLEQQDRLRLAGDEVTLPANAALTLGMTLHELATNAAKHGALSTAVGEVDVSWRHEPAAAGGQLVLLWQERGGPEVSPPERRSFGTRLIEDGIAYEFGGEVNLEFLPPGVRCELRFPLERSDGPPGHL